MRAGHESSVGDDVLMPWTQSLALAWRPELRFYEKRLEILRALEERGDLWAFRASEDRVQARLVDQWQQMSVRQSGVALHLLSPAADEERSWKALALASEMVQPKEIRSLSIAFQYAVELPIPFADAARRGGRALVAGFGLSGVSVPDWAVLVDVALDEALGARGQAEFGIVRALEVPVRLARDVGRIGFPDPPVTSAELWENEEFPPVAVFMDIALNASIDASMDGLATLREFWETSRAQAGSLVADLKSRLLADDNSEQVAL